MTPSRGRPTATRTAEIDAAIRLAARRSFLESGFDATRMDVVASAARVSKGTLYARYAGKDALFRAVIDDLLETMSSRAGRDDHRLPANLEDRLRHHARIMIAAFGWSEYALANRLVANAAHNFPEIEKIWQEAGAARYVAFLANDMAETAPENAPDWTFLANLFLHGISGWYRTQLAISPVSSGDAAAYCDKVIAMIMTTITGRQD
jgi:TetR/AcrR family transcriptional regulator, mexJK operon transcriptional repressor